MTPPQAPGPPPYVLKLKPSLGYWFRNTTTDPAPTPAGWWTPAQGQYLTTLHGVVRKLPYQSDQGRFGQPQVWTADADGDCEDKATWILLNLALKGWPLESMRVYVGAFEQDAVPRFVAHAVPVVRVGRGDKFTDLVADFRLAQVVPLNQINHYLNFQPRVEAYKTNQA